MATSAIFTRKIERYTDMSVDKKNCEGYQDPTAYEALNTIIKEEKASRSFRPIVYICSPYAGDVEDNTRRAQRYCRFAVANGYLPLAPHLFFPQFMDDGDKDERNLAMFMGSVLLTKCAEVWVFGSTISAGMTAEIKKAQEKQKTIRYFTRDCKEASV
jgi:dienelactone hydrolase